MNQDNLDKKFKDILDTMDEQDTLEAMKRKECIWQKVTGEKKVKKKNYLWLLLLIGGLLILGIWHFNSHKTRTSSSSTQSFANADNQFENYKLELTQARTALETNQRLLDSVSLVSQDLATKLIALTAINESTTTRPVSIKYDTVYLTEIKIEEIIIEKIVQKTIRDTVFLERIITQEKTEPIADLDSKKNPRESEASSESSNRPSSIQYNFSEANRENNK